MLKKLTNNKKGFTLIELMIVIAIIGILAAIAIPNFISYRNKSYCSQAEADARGAASAISDYFSDPAHTSTPAIGDLSGYTPKNGTGNVDISGADPNVQITVTVTDASNRCPRGDDFVVSLPQQASDGWQ